MVMESEKVNPFRQETPEEGRRTYRPKCCEFNNKNEDNSLKTLNDKNKYMLFPCLKQLVGALWHNNLCGLFNTKSYTYKKSHLWVNIL